MTITCKHAPTWHVKYHVVVRRDPADLRKALSRVAALQGGHFTAAQARAVGYSYPAQHYHRQRGDWVRLQRGIYRLPDWPSAGYDDLIRWTLWTKGQGIVSHESALGLHDLGDVMPARVHLTIPPRFRGHRHGVVLHHAEVPLADVQEWEGFQVTTPVRSILDVAASGMEVDHLARVTRDAVDRGLASPTLLRRRAEEFGPSAALAVERALRQEGM